MNSDADQAAWLQVRGNGAIKLEVQMTNHSGASFWRRPGTRPGWWAVGLGLAYGVLSLINSAVFMRLSEDLPWRQTVLPIYGIVMLLCGLAAGLVGAIAIIRQHERSWLVWLTVLAGALVVAFLLGEFLIPH